MTEEDEAGDHPSEEQKGSRRARFKDRLSRTKSKFKRHRDDATAEEGDYKLPDDVNDFLQAGRPPTTADDALPANPLPSETALPSNPISSPRRLQLPRIDVSGATRFPDQRELNIPDNGGSLGVPELVPRSRSHGSARRKKYRHLSVSFSDDSPVIIGEGGDDAEDPPTHILKPRARSVSPAYSRTRLAGGGQPRDGPVLRPGPFTAHPARTITGPTDLPLRRIERTLTSGHHLSPVGAPRDAMNREFEMTLQPPPSGGDGSNNIQAPLPVRPIIKPPSPSPPTDHAMSHPPRYPPTSHQSSLKPITKSLDLQIQFAEGRALREAHYRNLSNSSFIAENSPTTTHPLPPLQDLNLDDHDHDASGCEVGQGKMQTGNLKDVLSPRP